ncbi:MAG TPA: M67 family metallopeptidase [Humisphaera sp.]
MSQPVPPLIFPAALFRQIETEGEAGYPNEICGMIFGREAKDAGGATVRHVERLVVGKNVFEADEQYHRFSIDPLAQLKAERAAEKDGLVLLGYYHSHPDHPARPSEYDREHAWEFYSYVIVAIAKAKAVDMTSWVLDGGSKQFAQQEIRRA